MDPRETSITESLRKEHQQLLVRLDRARDRARRLRDLADQAAEQVEADERMLRSLAEVLGVSPQTTIDELGVGLRGHRLRQVAVEVLKQHFGPGEAVHYRDWFAMLQDANIAVAGRDPLATFLAQVSRAEDVEAVGRRSGRYRLRNAA